MARNTPTCVGKTDEFDSFTEACEETPPRAWGRRVARIWMFFICRNTPTCVGKTYRMGWVHEEIWKHPHVRGEDRLRMP